VIVSALTGDLGHASNLDKLRTYGGLVAMWGGTFPDGCYKKFVLD
jgi:hypothetical protein